MQININPISSKGLFRVEKYTDMASGELHIHIPVNIYGEEEPLRLRKYLGTSVINANGRAMPITFEVEATTLLHAIEEWPLAMMKKIEELQAEASRPQLVNGEGKRLIAP